MANRSSLNLVRRTDGHHRHRSANSLTEALTKKKSSTVLKQRSTRAIDLLRRKCKSVEIDEIHYVSNLEPHHHVVGADLAAWLRNAAAQLPEQQAADSSLSHLEQLDRNEVAAILTRSVEAVSTALYKARQRLQEQLKSFNGVR